MVTTIALEDNMQSKSDLINNKPWTRQEDMILLQSIKKEYSENSFLLISKKLENRTVYQVTSFLPLIILQLYVFYTQAHTHVFSGVCACVYVRVCIIIKFLIVGEREMSNFTFFTAENDVIYVYIYIFVIFLL